MPVRVGIVGKCYLVLVFEAHQSGHRIRTGAIHTNLAVVIDSHEREGRVDGWIDDGNVQPVNGIDRFPKRARGSAQRIDRKLEASVANGLHIDNALEIANVRQNEIFLMCARSFDGFVKRDALYLAVCCTQQFVGAILNPAGCVGIGGTAVRRVVLEASVFRRIVRRGDENAVGQMFFTISVVNENGSRDHRSRSYTVSLLDHRLHVVGSQHFQRRALRDA